LSAPFLPGYTNIEILVNGLNDTTVPPRLMRHGQAFRVGKNSGRKRGLKLKINYSTAHKRKKTGGASAYRAKIFGGTIFCIPPAISVRKRVAFRISG
jgi:hypothetical protein